MAYEKDEVEETLERGEEILNNSKKYTNSGGDQRPTPISEYKNPSYTPVPVAKRSYIDPGEKLEITLTVTGFGAVERNKLYISLSSDELLNIENPGKVTLTYSSDNTDPYNNKEQTSQPVDSQMQITMGGDFVDPLREENSSSRPNAVPPVISEMCFPAEGCDMDNHPSSNSDDEDTPNPGQANTDTDPPIHIELITSEDASPGDYELYFILTYIIGGNVYQSKESTTIHINNWVEQYNERLRKLTIATSIIVVVISAASFFI